MAETPQSCVEHQDKYPAKAWEGYSLAELGYWVHLLTKRAKHRSDFAKKDKDLLDAQNYLNMMQSKLVEAKHFTLEDFLPAAIRWLEEHTNVSLSDAEPAGHPTVYVSFVMLDGDRSKTYEGFWECYVVPAIMQIANGLNPEEEVFVLDLKDPPDPLGARQTVVTADNMSIRATTSYDSLVQVDNGPRSGMRYVIEVGVGGEELSMEDSRKL